MFAAHTSSEERHAARDNPEKQATWLADPAWETVVSDKLREWSAAPAQPPDAIIVRG